MVAGQSLMEKNSYNGLTTFVFLGVVVMLPVFLFFQAYYIFELYGVIPLTLAFWTFLREPVVQIKRRKMQSLHEKYPEIAIQISNLQVYSSLKNHPVLLHIPSETTEIFAFGTWRKQYIAISEGAINRWNDPAIRTSVITHEIAHIAHGDTWKTGFPAHYLYWVFAIVIHQFITNFPYSLFFETYSEPARGSWGISDIITPLTILILQLAILLAVRFLYRMKEFSADEYAKANVGLSNYAKAFAVPLQKKPQRLKEKIIVRPTLQENIFRAFRFHPTTQTRLRVLQSPLHLNKELSSLLFVIGLAIGYTSCFFLDLDSSFGVMLASEIVVGFIVLVILVPLHPDSTFADFMKVLVENVCKLANGIALAFGVLVGINNLFVENKGRGGMYFLQGDDLKFALFTTLDVLLLILILIPAAIILLAVMSRFLGRIISTKGFVWRPILFSVISQSPLAILWGLYIIRWWDGGQIPFETFSYQIFFCFLWFLFSALLWRLVSQHQYKQTGLR